MTNSITMTRDGGFYYRAMAFHMVFVAAVFLPMMLLVFLALINPFWFRNAMFSRIELWTTRLARWRDRIKYRLYLGTDPDMWHALKDKQ